MKKTVMILAALAVSSAWAITATKEYVDRSTNACLIAANRYTDEHGGGGGGGASTNVVNDLIVSYDQTNLAARIAASTKVESVNGKTGVVTIVGADVGNIAWSALTNQYGESVSAVDISYQPPEEGAFDPNVRSALDSIYYTAHDAQNTISSHVSNRSNPHQVTAAQVGALPSGVDVDIGDHSLNARNVYASNDISFGGSFVGSEISISQAIKLNGTEVVYGVSTNGTDYLHENVNLAPWGAGILSQAEAASGTIAAEAVANAVTTYAATNGIVALNQSVQYVVGNGNALTILAPSTVANGTRDWLVYIDATADTALDLTQLPHILVADAAYTNAVKANKVTMLAFSEVTNNVFVIGRQELTAVK